MLFFISAEIKGRRNCISPTILSQQCWIQFTVYQFFHLGLNFVPIMIWKIARFPSYFKIIIIKLQICWCDCNVTVFDHRLFKSIFWNRFCKSIIITGLVTEPTISWYIIAPTSLPSRYCIRYHRCSELVPFNFTPQLQFPIAECCITQPITKGINGRIICKYPR